MISEKCGPLPLGSIETTLTNIQRLFRYSSTLKRFLENMTTSLWFQYKVALDLKKELDLRSNNPQLDLTNRYKMRMHK